jgi:hypothetical protein
MTRCKLHRPLTPAQTEWLGNESYLFEVSIALHCQFPAQ